MQHGASKRVEEQSRTGMIIKTKMKKAVQSTAYVDIEINVNYTKKEPGLVEVVKSEPALLVKKEVAEDGWQGPSTSAIVGSMNVFAGSADVGNILVIKEELGLTVPQREDTHDRTNKPDTRVIRQENDINNDDNAPVLCSRVKKEIVEVEWSGSEARIYICDYCPKTFTKKSSLIYHITSVHASGSYKCSQCNKRFKCERYLTTHKSYVHAPRMHVCNVCGKSIKLSNLSQHMRNVHSNKQQQCKLCGKTVKSKQCLHQHLKDLHGHRSAGSGTYICDYCQKTFTIKTRIMDHITRVHASGSYKCSQCNRRFKCEQYLMSHMTYMHSDKQLQCKLCGQTMKSKHYLRKHLNVHHGQHSAVSLLAVYTCDYCHKTYPRKHTLVGHLENVHGKVIHRCSECKVELKSKGSLQRHIKVVHSKEVHECEFCKKIFKTKQYYNTHVRLIHCKDSTGASAHSESPQQSSFSSFGKNFNSKCTSIGDLSAVASTSTQQYNVVVMKEEPDDRELVLGPVEFQHMDCNYRPYKQESQFD